MVTTKKAAGKKTGKLRLKKETIKSLDVKKSGNVKGGVVGKQSQTCNVTMCQVRRD